MKTGEQAAEDEAQAEGSTHAAESEGREPEGPGTQGTQNPEFHLLVSGSAPSQTTATLGLPVWSRALLSAAGRLGRAPCPGWLRTLAEPRPKLT